MDRVIRALIEYGSRPLAHTHYLRDCVKSPLLWVGNRWRAVTIYLPPTVHVAAFSICANEWFYLLIAGVLQVGRGKQRALAKRSLARISSGTILTTACSVEE